MTRPGTLSRKGVRLVPRLAGVHLCAPRARPLLQAHLADLQLARRRRRGRAGLEGGRREVEALAGGVGDVSDVQLQLEAVRRAHPRASFLGMVPPLSLSLSPPPLALSLPLPPSLPTPPSPRPTPRLYSPVPTSVLSLPRSASLPARASSSPTSAPPAPLRPSAPRVRYAR